MRKIILFVLFVYFTVFAVAQKRMIDSAAAMNWPSISSPTLSPDGKYCYYIVSKYPEAKERTLIVQSTTKSWKKNILGGSIARFSDDSRYLVYMRRDTLNILTLDNNELKYVTNVKSFEVPKSLAKCVAYLKNNTSQDLILLNLSSGEQRQYSNVMSYLFNDNGSVLILNTQEKLQDTALNKLLWVDLIKDRTLKIWVGDLNTKVRKVSFHSQGDRLAFFTEGTHDGRKKMWYYSDSLAEAVLLQFDVSILGSDSVSIDLDQAPVISRDGKWFFFYVQRSQMRVPNAGLAKVNVWNYQDRMLQSQQLINIKQRQDFLAAVSTAGGKCLILEDDVNEVVSKSYLSKLDDFVIVKNSTGIPTDFNWLQNSYYVLNLKDGSRSLFTKSEEPLLFTVSPDSRHIVYFNCNDHQYYLFNTYSKKKVNITQAVPTNLSFDKCDKLDKRNYNAVGIGGWMRDGDLLVYDNYDLWKISITNHTQPINLTNGYGRRHKIKFRLLNFDDPEAIPINDTLLLSAFETTDKNNGFFCKIPSISNPVKLSMGPYSIYRIQKTLSQEDSYLSIPFKPIKAQKSKTWIVKIMTASRFPNLYVTNDFKEFNPLSTVVPEKTYNWLTAELVSWKLKDGNTSQGILYKPEDFDSTKKYPVIFNYYENMSDRLYEYPRPMLSEDNLNIPWFVSRGYLIFTPDILLTTGKVGRSALNTIISAAKYLSRKKYVDSNKMALQGHSFGATLTNYVIAHTNRFAAAVEAAGVSDWVSAYLSLRGNNGLSRYYIYEHSQSRIGSTLWQKPDDYLENSIILGLDKVQTPLLIMHNKNDWAVPWEQGIELYLGLRRLHKPVWMLQYDEGGHNVFDVDALDYTLRMTQFFDHYLKGVPAPIWMTKGIPAERKAIDTGYGFEFDRGSNNNN